MGKIISLLVTLTVLLRSRQDVKCQMQTCILNCSMIIDVAAYDVNILSWILIYAQEKELFKCR